MEYSAQVADGWSRHRHCHQRTVEGPQTRVKVVEIRDKSAIFDKHPAMTSCSRQHSHALRVLSIAQ